MNRFWGRNELGAVLKFSRDDDQILALNYENLCDADYLNRLFVSDVVIPPSEEAPAAEAPATAAATPPESTLYNSDLPEDLIIYGDNVNLGRIFFQLRFSRELVGSFRNQDAVASLVSRQSVVFEHIGKLMIQRCSEELPEPPQPAQTEADPMHMAAVALHACLKLLEREKCTSLKCQTLEPLVSMIFQICQEAVVRVRLPAPKVRILSAEHVNILRGILSQASLNCLSPFGDARQLRVGRSATEEGFRSSLASFYGLLALGLQTRNASEILVAISRLMVILLRLEEWQEAVRVAAMSDVISVIGGSVIGVGVVSGVSGEKSSSPVVGVVGVVGASPSKASMKLKAAKGQPSPGPTDKVTDKGDKADKTTDSLVHQEQQDEARAEANPSKREANNNATNVTNATAGTLTSGQHSNSSSNLKSWGPKLPEKGDKVDRKLVGKGKAEARGIQEILDPNLYPAQELESYITANPSFAQHARTPNQGLSPPRVSKKGGGNNGNNGEEGAVPDLVDPSWSAKSVDLGARHKKSMQEFRESLRALVRVPKPVLKVLHDGCAVVALEDKGEPVVSPIPALVSQYTRARPAEAQSVSSYVWSCGQNSYGELGMGDSTMRKSFAKVSCLDDKRVVSIGAGNEHSLFVTQEGKLYTAGYNDNGQCGMGSTQQVRQPTVVAALEGEEIAQVHVYNGCEHTLAVTREGKIFSFGYNYRGQLGLGSTTSESTPRPIRGLLSRRVVLAACSYHHSVMLCADGSLYSCGRNDSGQLGHGDTVDKKTPQTVISCPKGIVSISCGQFHTVAATSSGAAFVCGKNDYGQLGIENSSNVKIFTEIGGHPEIEQIVQVCCGYYHTLILSNSGIVAGFGRNDYGQLGLGHAQPKVYSCTAIGTLRDKGVRMVSAGCYHSVVITANGMLYVFGRNNHGQLATGDQEERHSPHPVDDFVGQRILSVAAGFYHTIVLTTAPVAVGVKLSGGLSVTDVVEAAGVSVGLCDPLEGTLTDAPSPHAVLMKDTALLTGIVSSSKVSSVIVPFTFERRSRTSIRELLLFLLNHVDTLACFAPVETPTAPSAPTSAPVSLSASASLHWVANVLSSVVSMLHLCSGVLEDTAGAKLPISFEEALDFTLKLVRMTALLLRTHGDCLALCLSKSVASGFEDDDLGYMQQLLEKRPPTEAETEASKIVSTLEECLSIGIEVGDGAGVEEGVCRSLSQLRRKLLTLYFAVTPDQQQNPKYQAILTDIAGSFAQCHDLLLPSPALVGEFFSLLRGSTIPTPTPSTHPSVSSPCLRMLTLFTAAYRSSDNVVRLFQTSKLHALKVFGHMLALYGHFSMHSLKNRHTSEVRRLISVLDHCVSNFIKCAVPIIFAAAPPVAEPPLRLGDAKAHAELFSLGVGIIREVLQDATRLVDYVLSQPQSDEVLGLLRYGTIIPSILPSILIYGIAFTKYGCLMLEVTPDLALLVQRLQLIGPRQEGQTQARNVITTAMVSAKSVASSAVDKRPGVSPSEADTARAGAEIPKGESEAEAFSDELFQSKRDPQQISWWFRLIKLSTTFISKMAAVMVNPPSARACALPIARGGLTRNEPRAYVLSRDEPEELCSLKMQRIVYHDVWRFICYAPPTNGDTIEYVRGEQERAEMERPSELVALCGSFREREKTHDAVYKMLTQGQSHQSPSPSKSSAQISMQLFLGIEEALLQAVVHLSGMPLALPLPLAVSATLPTGASISTVPVPVDPWARSQAFRAIARFTKRLHSRRSALVSSSGSWTHLLARISRVVDIFSSVIVRGQLKLTHCAPLPLPRLGKEGKRARTLWRRAIMLVVCAARWRSCWRLRARQLVPSAVIFVSAAVDLVTNDLSVVPEEEELCARVGRVLRCFGEATQSAENCAVGLSTVQGLLEGLTANSLKCDVLTVLIGALRERGEAHSAMMERFPSSSAVRCCAEGALHRDQSASRSLQQHLVRQTTLFALSPGVFSHYDLQLLSSSVRFLQLCMTPDRDPPIPLPILKALLVALSNCIPAVEVEEKVSKKGSVVRERNAAYRRTSHVLLCFLQACTHQSLSGRPHLCAQLLSLHNELVCSCQASRLESMRSDALSEEVSRMSLDGKDQKQKEGSRRRCQDLITKPREFCRTVEGFVVQGEKLLNNYKGVDFTIACWLLVAKKSPSKHSFITGKVSHNDAWPLVLLRSDGKIDILFGHNNEFDRISTEASVPQGVWTHLAVIVEQKKIKVFMNGVMDSQVNASKGNGRAVLFPLLIGSCPLNVRTRVSYVKEGFDGMLAQYKYYSRALSPIHVKVVYDAGPPETSDLSARLVYQMISSLKCLLGPLSPPYVREGLTATAATMHLLFVTDASRRTRFAALSVLSDILLLDVVEDMELSPNWVNPVSAATATATALSNPHAPPTLLVTAAPFLHSFSGFHERLVGYFLRLAGVCWAPHFLHDLAQDSDLNTNSPTGAGAGMGMGAGAGAGAGMDVGMGVGGEDWEDTLLSEFLRFSPCLSIVSEPTPQSLSANGSTASMVDKLAAKEEVRGQICNHVIKLLFRLSAVPRWSAAISGAMQKVLDGYAAHIAHSLEVPPVLKVDAVGAALLLGGGSSGAYTGTEARTFYGDAPGRILSLNKTTNFATLVCWNDLYGHQQIVRVRMADLIIRERQDVLALGQMRSLLPHVLGVLEALSGYIPLLLSDYLSTLSEHAFQKTLLRAMRPVEIFVFSQLLHALSTVADPGPSSARLMAVLQQAAMATLPLPPEAHHLGNFRGGTGVGGVGMGAGGDRSLSSLWLRSANYVASMPERVVLKSFLAVDEIKTLSDYVGMNFSLSTDSLLVPAQARLLKQGRLSELVQLLAAQEGPRDAAHVCLLAEIEQDGAVGGASSNTPTASLGGDVGVGGEGYLISDWPPSAQWPSAVESAVSELDCADTLLLLHLLRRTIVLSSRSMLSARPVHQGWAREEVVWQSLLPSGGFDLCLIDMLQPRECGAWRGLCAGLYPRRVEVTQMLGSGLRYCALTLLQSNPAKSENVFASLDIFPRILHTTLHWAAYCDLQGGEEVSVWLLRTLLPALSFIENAPVALQLTQLCMHLVRRLGVKAFGDYLPSRELLDLARSNNFTLLRARAQEHMLKYKTHNMGNISPLTYNLTQLVCGLELIQRQGALSVEGVGAGAGAGVGVGAGGVVAGVSGVSVVGDILIPPGSSTKATLSAKALCARLQGVETAPPRVTSVRSCSVDADLSACATLNLSLGLGDWGAGQGVEGEGGGQGEHVIVEVALGTTSPKSSDGFLETVYCGASLRFVQSGLVPDCTYYMKCRAYVGSNPLAWSCVVEFRTQKGVLFTFDAMKCGPDILLGEDGLTASYANDDNWSTLMGSRAFSSGVTHWDIRINASSTAYVFVGVASSSADLSSFLGGCAHGWGFIGEQALYHNREKVKVYGESFASGDIVGVTLDLTQGTLSFSRNHKSLGVAFDKMYGELYPAVAFYNVGQELEILVDGFKTTSSFESIPVSPSRLNMDDISLLNELVLCLYRGHPLSHRLQGLVVEHCNQWVLAGHVRHRAVSGRYVFLATESPLLRKVGLTVGERVRTKYAVAEVAGAAYSKLWFKMNPAGDVWYFSMQQVAEGRAKKLFMRCTYEEEGEMPEEGLYQVTYDVAAVQELLDPARWSEEMDLVLLAFLERLSGGGGGVGEGGEEGAWAVSAQQVTDNFRTLQQQFSRIMLGSTALAHRWGIAGPKRKAVLARIGLLRLLNQMLQLYLPFLISDSTSKPFAANQPTLSDDFAPMVVSLKFGTTGKSSNYSGQGLGQGGLVQGQAQGQQQWQQQGQGQSFLTDQSCWPLMCLSWDDAPCASSVTATELLTPLHALRRLIFHPTKMSHLWEVLRRTLTRPAKTEDDYDYPEDLPHVKINRLKSFRAKEASELMQIPGEDLMLSSMFCQLWRELRQYNDEKLRISYSHPMDDGQSRTFKIKFEGEGVDDYGGPYREIFQQIFDELQSMDPSAVEGQEGGDLESSMGMGLGGMGGGLGSVQSSQEKRPSSWVAGEGMQSPAASLEATPGGGTGASTAGGTAGTGGGGGVGGVGATPTRCFLPLLMPTPNWTADIDCTERYRYMFHPAACSPLKMDLFHFMGQLVGIAVRSRITLDLNLPSYVWKYVVCERLTERDIASFDAPAYDFLQRLGAAHRQLSRVEGEGEGAALSALQSNALELICDLTWSYTRSDGVLLELLEGRGQEPVALTEVGRYLVLYTEARLTESREAIGMFRRGLVSILPESALGLLNWEELQAVVCGARVIDVERLRDNTEYDDDLSPEDEHILIFWEVLSAFTEAEKSAFLRFIWARPTLPPAGVEFTQKMRVLSAVGDDATLKPDQYLPKAHTCFFSINLPRYSTRDIMRDKLLFAIFNCTEMDADFRTTEPEIAGWGGASSVPDWQGV